MNRIKKYFNNIIAQYRKEHRFEIVDYNNHNQNLIIFCRWTKQRFVIYLNDIIGEEYIISNILPEQACFAGLQIGENILALNISNHNPHKNTRLSDSITSYSTKNLSMIINREGYIKFLNLNGFTDEFINPINVAKNKNLINIVPPEQALLLGVHVSLNRAKILINNRKQSKSFIKLVKNA